MLWVEFSTRNQLLHSALSHLQFQPLEIGQTGKKTDGLFAQLQCGPGLRWWLLPRCAASDIRNVLRVIYSPITYNHLWSPGKFLELGYGERAQVLAQPRSPPRAEASSIPGTPPRPAPPFSSAGPTLREGPRAHVVAGGGEVGGSAAAILPAWRRSVRSAGRALYFPSPPLALSRAGFRAPPHFWLLWPLPEWRTGEPRRAGGVCRARARALQPLAAAAGARSPGPPGIAQGGGEGAAPAAEAAAAAARWGPATKAPPGRRCRGRRCRSHVPQRSPLLRLFTPA